MHLVRYKETDQESARDNSEKFREHLFGLDFLWTAHRYELSGEAVYRIGNASSTQDEWGVFLQGVAPLTRRLFAIGRYERFKPSGSGPGMHVWVIALAFRPIPPLILKAEYIIAHGTHDHLTTLPDGFTTSISLLF